MNRHLAAALALPILACSLAPAAAGPKRDAALQDCKNIYEDQQKHCAASSNYAACMTMITEQYESCRAQADTIVGLQTGQPKPSKFSTNFRLDRLPSFSQ